MTPQPWGKEEFVERLQEVGARAYHDRHPFHLLMNAGQLDRKTLRLWVTNRFYYQRNIPVKDAAILSNCPVREVRQGWIRRILDQDGHGGEEGGIEKWIRLGIACGLTREEMVSGHCVLPAVRFAVDAYVNFARMQPWPIAVASSLTELFAPGLMSSRLEAFGKYYPWIVPDGLDYFRARLTQARADAEFALSITLRYCGERNLQEAAVEALGFKCDVLWSMLDAVTRWEVENGELRLFFPSESRALAEMLQARDPMERLRTVLNQVVGQPLRVCVKLDSGRAGMGRSSELRARFEEDPIVRAMLEKFGGQISKVKRPGEE